MRETVRSILLAALVLLTGCGGSDLAFPDLVDVAPLNPDDGDVAVLVEVVTIADAPLPSSVELCAASFEDEVQRLAVVVDRISEVDSERLRNVILNFQAASLEYVSACANGVPEAEELQQEAVFYRDVLLKWGTE